MPLDANLNSKHLVLIMGNGPSSKLVDFDLLQKNRIASVGMNAAYRYWDRIDFSPTFYICMDTMVIQSHAERIAELIREGRISKFFLRNEFLQLYPEFNEYTNILWFDDARNRKNSIFDTDWITTGSWAIRWMVHEGMRTIATIGVDANYVELLSQAERVGEGKDLRLSIRETPKYNPNYFFADYQQVGDFYNIPNDPAYVSQTGQLVHVDALRKVKDDIKHLGKEVTILDCSPISNHGTFSKIDINYLSVIHDVSKMEFSSSRSNAIHGLAVVTSFFLMRQQ